MNTASKFLPLSLFLAIASIPSTSSARVTRAGDWPKDEKRVTLDWEGEREGAVRELAKAAGWNLVGGDLRDHERVSIHVKNVPADAVLDAVFDASPGNYEAKRSGELLILRVAPSEEATPKIEVPPKPPEPPTKAGVPANVDPPPVKSEAPTDQHDERGQDRAAKGESIRIEKDEIVHDVSVVGGSVEVFGKVTGDLVVVGGTAKVHDEARVKGDAVAIGGSIDVEKGAAIDGNTISLGGVIHREEGAITHGKVESSVWKRDDVDAPEVKRTLHERISDGVGSVLSRFALIFLFGAIALSLRPERMESLRHEVARRPLRSVGLGVVASVAASVAAVILCVTIIGIPLALAIVLVGAVAVYVGLIVVSGLVGELLLRHKTKSVHAHLALGAAIFALLTQVPVLGTLVGFATVLAGLGAIVSDRANIRAVSATPDATAYRG